jgi:hypothetical protein
LGVEGAAALFLAGLCHEEFVRVVAYTGGFPGETAKGHAAEDDGKGPDVGGPGIVFGEVVDFGCEVGVGTYDTWLYPR